MPESVGSVVALLLLIAPGLAFELLRERHRPRIASSTLRETSVVVLSSILFGGVAALLLWLQQAGGDDRLPDPKALVLKQGAYVEAHFQQAMVGLVSQVTLSLTLAVATNYLLVCARPGGSYSKADGWHELSSGRGNPGRNAIIAAVEDSEGTTWTGYLKGFEVGDDGKLASVALHHLGGGHAITRKERGSEAVTLNPHWAYVAVPGDEIRSLRLRYIEVPTDAT